MCHDMQETKKEIAKCAKTPLSIVIIGVGKGDEFHYMEELDADEEVSKIW